MKRMLSWIAVTAVLTVGCASHHAIQRAQESLDQAKQAGAEKAAPYEYHAADAYLTYAVEEREESDWGAAERFAEKSIQYSEKAVEKAKGGAQ